MAKPSSLRTERSLFSFLPDKGCQWSELLLQIPTELENGESISLINGYQEEKGFFFSGNFCMFPWVNRMWPNSFIKQKELQNLSSSLDSDLALDGNGFPLHGRIFGNQWNQTKQENQFFLDYLDPIQNRKCRIEQSFDLGKSSLTTNIKIKNLEPEAWIYSLGYHPYFQLPFGNVDDWIIELHGAVHSVPLDRNCFPIREYLDDITSLPIPSLKVIPLNGIHLDHLYYFSEGLQISLYHPEHKFALWIESFPNNLFDNFSFCQIYTPDNRKSIAIEPMLTPGNFETLYNKYLLRNFQKKEKSFQFSLQLKSNKKKVKK